MSGGIKVDIKKSNNSSADETVSYVREFGVCPLTNEDFILVKFSVRESGYYEIHVMFQNEHLVQSPILLRFLPSFLDPEKSTLIRKCPTMIYVTNSENVMLIEPKDRFGNLCRLEDLTTSQFSFKVSHVSLQAPHRTNLLDFICN